MLMMTSGLARRNTKEVSVELTEKLKAILPPQSLGARNL
jgi:hypothetical protein